jgi:hypothetical protein
MAAAAATALIIQIRFFPFMQHQWDAEIERLCCPETTSAAPSPHLLFNYSIPLSRTALKERG